MICRAPTQCTNHHRQWRQCTRCRTYSRKEKVFSGKAVSLYIYRKYPATSTIKEDYTELVYQEIHVTYVFFSLTLYRIPEILMTRGLCIEFFALNSMSRNRRNSLRHYQPLDNLYFHSTYIQLFMAEMFQIWLFGSWKTS